MKVLLVQSYLGRIEPEGPVYPIGLCYIATALSDKGNEVRVFDPNISEDHYGELKKHLSDFEPQAVGISIRNIDTTQKRDLFCYFKTVPPTVELIKGFNPHIKVIVGGAGFSMFAREIMERIAGIDYGIYLEGEESFPELLNNLHRPERVRGIYIKHNGRTTFTGPRVLPDFGRLPIPRRDFVDITKYYDPLNQVGIQTKRGCPQKCAYCSYSFLNGNNVRMRTPQHIVDEMEYLIKEFKTSQFFFVDGVFNIPASHVIAICNEIIRRGLDVGWKAWCEPTNITVEFMELAKRAGCKGMAFSPDAISDKSLAILNKGFTQKDVLETIRVARKIRGMKVGFSFFSSPPGQDLVGLLKTIYLFFKINIMFMGRGGAGLSWIRIEPHTRMHQIAVKDGLIQKDTNLLPDNEGELARLFYSSPRVRYGDFIVELILSTVENLLAFARFILRRKRVRRKL